MHFRGSHRPSVVPITAPSFPTPSQPRVYRKIAYTFAAFTLIIVIAVLWLSSERAEVSIKVKRSTVKVDTTLEVAKNPTSGQLPGRVVSGTFNAGPREFQVPEPVAATSTAVTSSSTPATTLVTTSLPATPAGDYSRAIAKGTVRIVNKYSRAQTLVKTTRLLTADGKLYRIDKTISVPAGGTASVSAYADKPGAEYAVGPTKFTIPGLWIDLQKFIYAESDAPFTVTAAGSATTVSAPVVPVKPVATTSTVMQTKSQKIVTAALLEDYANQLKEAAFEQGKQTLSAEVADTKFTRVTYYTHIVDQSFNVKAGQTADTVNGTLKLEVTAVYYSPDDMSTFVRSKLKEKLPDGREFLPFNDQALSISLDSSDVKNEKATVHVVADAEYRITATNPALQKSAVAGRKKDEVIMSLKAIEGVEDVQIKMNPSWISKIPSLQDHIEIKVE